MRKYRVKGCVKNDRSRMRGGQGDLRIVALGVVAWVRAVKPSMVYV